MEAHPFMVGNVQDCLTGKRWKYGPNMLPYTTPYKTALILTTAKCCNFILSDKKNQVIANHQIWIQQYHILRLQFLYDCKLWLNTDTAEVPVYCRITPASFCGLTLCNFSRWWAVSINTVKAWCIANQHAADRGGRESQPSSTGVVSAQGEVNFPLNGSRVKQTTSSASLSCSNFWICGFWCFIWVLASLH